MNKPASLFIVTAFLAHTGLAWAAPDETADAAMKRGNVALKAGRIHEACTAFDAGVKLDAKIENQLSLAACLEQDGKPVTAARIYRGVAEKDTNASRRKTSLAKADKLEATAPKLRFAINPNPPGLVIKVDGVEVSSTGDVLVDHGPHEVIATAPGFTGRASAPVDRDGAIVDVIIRMQPVAESVAPPTETDPAIPPPVDDGSTMRAIETSTEGAPSKSNRKRNGAIMVGGGAVMLVGAVVFYALSSKRFDDSHEACPNKRCGNDAVLEYALDARSDARALRGTSYGVGIGGVVLLGVGAYFLLTPDKAESNVSFNIEPGRADVAYTLSF